MPKQKFVPNWFDQPTPDGTYRSLYKWGDPAGFKHPNSGLVRLIMETFGVTQDDLKKPINLGLEKIEGESSISLSKAQLGFFTSLCGEENVAGP